MSMESVFRRAKNGTREPLAVPHQGGTHIHHTPSRRVSLGCITSRRRPPPTFFEVLAYELGCHVNEAKRRWIAGEIT